MAQIKLQADGLNLADTFAFSGTVTGVGLDVASITGATALAVQPASDDEIVFSDAGTLKRLDIKHIQNTPAFHVNNPQNGSMATNTQETMEFDTEVLDSDGCFDTSTFRFTPAVQGKYFIYYNVRWQIQATACTRINGTVRFNDSSNIIQSMWGHTDYSTVTGSGIINMDADDFIELAAFHNVGSDSEITTETDVCFFGGFRISGVS